jgi:hypothetical protein
MGTEPVELKAPLTWKRICYLMSAQSKVWLDTRGIIQLVTDSREEQGTNISGLCRGSEAAIQSNAKRLIIIVTHIIPAKMVLLRITITVLQLDDRLGHFLLLIYYQGTFSYRMPGSF